MSAYITHMGTANPPHRISQNDVHSFMVKAHQLNDNEANDLKVLYRASGISHRYSVLGDYSKKDDFEFYANSDDLEPFPGTKKRADLYAVHAGDLSIAAIHNCLPKGFDFSEITHLITVSCTGLYAPGLDIDLVMRLGLERSVERIGINFMGCYAAFNAIKTARAICGHDATAKVLVVCIELCSIHFQKQKTDDNLLSNALFGDGAAALLIQSEPSSEVAFKINNMLCDLLPNGAEDMAWKIGDFGFEMKLSSYVPDIIETGIHQLLDRLKAHEGGIRYDHYAIHPGGKKILSVIEKELGITKEHNRHAHEVLRQFGNMSSPTIIFVLQSLHQALGAAKEGEKILALAFGPGLTLESMTMEVVT